MLSSTEALCFSEPPQQLIVIGAGYIGLELGSVWNRLDSKVTVIEYSPTICPSMDKDIREKLLAILKKQGMNFHLSAKVTAVEAGMAGEAQNKNSVVHGTDGEGKTHTVKGDKVLVCVVRKPFTKNLGLENINLKPNSKGQIEVDKNRQTSVKKHFCHWGSHSRSNAGPQGGRGGCGCGRVYCHRLESCQL